MKHTQRMMASACALAACLVVPWALAAGQDKAPEKPAKETTRFDGPSMDHAEKQKIIEQMMAMMQPGPEHKRLESMAGQWKQTTRYWMQPGTEPKSIDGVGTNAMILGGRFLRCEIKGDFEGMPFEALHLLGFDRRTDKFTSVAFDTMGTYYVSAEGEYDAATKSIRMHGRTHDPKSNHTEIYTMVWREVSGDEFVTEVWFKSPDGKEFKVVEAIHTRTR